MTNSDPGHRLSFPWVPLRCPFLVFFPSLFPNLQGARGLLIFGIICGRFGTSRRWDWKHGRDRIHGNRGGLGFGASFWQAFGVFTWSKSVSPLESESGYNILAP
ncbi:hypothetical protein LX36DRAFT_329861 [Colletotrichum falcatum]|nr:hypothetical protein LX36DRAFT_329861 [Colletotrichum falcatum]